MDNNNQDNKNKNEERHATWLELFYDLVFVVTVSQLSHYLFHNLSLSNFFGFLFLFIPVWKGLHYLPKSSKSDICSFYNPT